MLWKYIGIYFVHWWWHQHLSFCYTGGKQLCSQILGEASGTNLMLDCNRHGIVTAHISIGPPEKPHFYMLVVHTCGTWVPGGVDSFQWPYLPSVTEWHLSPLFFQTYTLRTVQGFTEHCARKIIEACTEHSYKLAFSSHFTLPTTWQTKNSKYCPGSQGPA